jgi:hypothetical protein
VLLRRTPGWNPWLAWTVLAATAATVLILALARSRRTGAVLGRRLLIPAGVAGLIAVLAGPAAYAATPLSAAISGNNPVAGPTAGGGFAGLGGRGGFPGFGGGTRADYPGGEAGSGFGRPGPGASGQGADGQGAHGQGADGQGGAFRDGAFGDGTPGGGGFRLGGALGGAGGAVSKQLISYLEANRDGATWLVAVQGSSAAAGIILQTGGIPVMAMGGFTGSDAAPTVAQLEHYVKQGKLRYVLAGGRGGFGGGVVGGGAVGGGGGGTVAAALSWVEQNCAAVPASAYGGSAARAQALYRCG